jgi:UDP-N-acetylglucosamine:LPS N-acetylglucosamine transferase
MLGRGGGEINAASIAAAAASTPSRKWRIVGNIAPISNPPPNANFMGWVDSPAAFLARNTILIGSGGDGTVGAAAAAGCHLICIPQSRPYGEQLETAAALQRAGAAIICHKWPEASEWPALLERAADTDTAPLAALYDPMSARRIANFLSNLAADKLVAPSAQNGVPNG